MRQSVQIDSMADKLSNRLHNAIRRHHDFTIGYNHECIKNTVTDAVEDFFREIVDSCLEWPCHDRRLEEGRRWNSLADAWPKLAWYTKYDIVEAYLHAYRARIEGDRLLFEAMRPEHEEAARQRHVEDLFRPLLDKHQELTRNIQEGLVRDNSAYRLVGDQFTRIIDDVEIDAVDDALDNLGPWPEARAHLTKAIGFLGVREDPDYANAAKEALSAIEGICKSLCKGRTPATLGRALKALKHSEPDRDDLYEAFDRMLTFANNVGSRHALKPGGTPTTEAEARVIVITCSALVNFLVATHAAPTE